MSQPIPISGQDWNHFFDLAATIALIAMAIVIGAMIFFVVTNLERKGRPRKYAPEFKVSKSRPRENLIFATISIIILVSLVVASFVLLPNPRVEPDPSKSLVIDVTGSQWVWTFGYPNGKTSVDQLNLPGNTTVMFNVTSSDVMHQFYLIQFKVSIAAIAGRYNILWITTPVVTGNQEYNYDIACTQLCGVGHTFMDATMTVMNQTAYNDWLNNSNATSSSAGG